MDGDRWRGIKREGGATIAILTASDSASKNTDSSVFYTEIETEILNTDSA